MTKEKKEKKPITAKRVIKIILCVFLSIIGFVLVVGITFFHAPQPMMKLVTKIYYNVEKKNGWTSKYETSSTEKEIQDYYKELDNLKIFTNTIDKELPQTVTQKLVLDHFAAPLPEGKTKKKAIVIGFDGCRADGLENLIDKENSGVFDVIKQGGLYHTFAGGPKDRPQYTSTTPGWGCILTGGYKDYNGLEANTSAKKYSADTFLTTLAKQGVSGSFDISWLMHLLFNYEPDEISAFWHRYPITYTVNDNDEATFESVMNHVTKTAGQEKDEKSDPDVLFMTFEYTDEAGHGTGFTNDNPDYIKAVNDADDNAYKIVKAIEARDTYDTEDWLIILTTDHGGIDTNHGGQSIYERSTWLATNKKIANVDSYIGYEMK